LKKNTKTKKKIEEDNLGKKRKKKHVKPKKKREKRNGKKCGEK
jgi:hypothetical protein